MESQVTHPWGGWGSTGCLARPGCDATTAPLLPTPGQGCWVIPCHGILREHSSPQLLPRAPTCILSCHPAIPTAALSRAPCVSPAQQAAQLRDKARCGLECWVLAGVQEHQCLLHAASCIAALGCWNPAESCLHSLPVLQVSSREPSSRAARRSPAGL